MLRESVYSLRHLYYRFPKLFLYDLARMFYTLRSNPYTYLRRFPGSSLLKDGNVYGETPWSVLSKVSTVFGITSHDVVCDLGCGLGRVCFWFSYVVRAQVIGVDNQEPFLRFASSMHRKWKVPGVFFYQSFQECDLSQVTCVYFYGSSYSLRVLKDIVEIFQKLPPRAVVISISFPMNSIPGGEAMFSTEDSCEVCFPWGKTTAYKNRKF